jgi:hypothetical protein
MVVTMVCTLLIYIDGSNFSNHFLLARTCSYALQGLDVKLVGEANDYVGKGMNGGDIAIVPPPGSPFK